MKHELFKHLIKTANLETPSSEFTENLLDYLEMNQTLLPDKSRVLSQKLNKSLIPSLSADFTDLVITTIEENKQTSLIMTLFLQRVGIVIFSLFTIGLLFFEYQENSLGLLYFSEITIAQITWLKELITIPSVLSISVFAFASLLLLDSVLTKENNFNQKHKGAKKL